MLFCSLKKKNNFIDKVFIIFNIFISKMKILLEVLIKKYYLDFKVYCIMLNFDILINFIKGIFLYLYYYRVLDFFLKEVNSLKMII